MTAKSPAPYRSWLRPMAAGVLFSLLATYLLHVFGSWKLQFDRPDPDTTGSVILYNTCAVLNDTHILRPNYTMPAISDGIDQTKLAGSFLIFFDGHLAEMLVFAAVFGLMAAAVRKAVRRNVETAQNR